MPTTYSTEDWCYGSATSSGTYTITIGGGDSTCCSNTYTTYRIIERFVVELPKKWKKKDALAFVKLLNTDTHTAFKVTMLISGDVLLTDPTIHKRSMADFMPLLLCYASESDQKKIKSFFAKRKTD